MKKNKLLGTSFYFLVTIINLLIVGEFLINFKFGLVGRVVVAALICLYIVIIPLIKDKLMGLRKSLIYLGILILPYLGLLSYLIDYKMFLYGVFPVIMVMVYFWCIYYILLIVKDLKYLSIAAIFLITLFLYIIINIYLCLIYSSDLFTLLDFFISVILLIPAISFFAIGCKKELFNKDK